MTSACHRSVGCLCIAFGGLNHLMLKQIEKLELQTVQLDINKRASNPR
jgi:hypothetical protein